MPVPVPVPIAIDVDAIEASMPLLTKQLDGTSKVADEKTLDHKSDLGVMQEHGGNTTAEKQPKTGSADVAVPSTSITASAEGTDMEDSEFTSDGDCAESQSEYTDEEPVYEEEEEEEESKPSKNAKGGKRGGPASRKAPPTSKTSQPSKKIKTGKGGAAVAVVKNKKSGEAEESNEEDEDDQADSKPSTSKVQAKGGKAIKTDGGDVKKSPAGSKSPSAKIPAGNSDKDKAKVKLPNGLKLPDQLIPSPATKSRPAGLTGDDRLAILLRVCKLFDEVVGDSKGGSLKRDKYKEMAGICGKVGDGEWARSVWPIVIKAALSMVQSGSQKMELKSSKVTKFEAFKLFDYVVKRVTGGKKLTWGDLEKERFITTKNACTHGWSAIRDTILDSLR